jgi:hypothetical protein
MTRLRHPAPIRHPSEDWGLPVGGRNTSPTKIPAYAGMTVVNEVTEIGS